MIVLIAIIVVIVVIVLIMVIDANNHNVWWCWNVIVFVNKWMDWGITVGNKMVSHIMMIMMIIINI